MRPWLAVHVLAVLVVSAAAACGGDDDAPARAPAPAIRTATYDEAPAGREVVATVDGVPVYADCVATQAAGSPRPPAEARAAALDDCVAFELLAQAARARGLLDDADAIEAQKREAVRAMIAREFEPTLDGPDDVPRADLEKVWPGFEPYYNHPELRTTFYCRVAVDKKAARGGPEDVAARALAEELHAGLRPRALADGKELKAACEELAAGRPIEVLAKPYRLWAESRTDEAYKAAALAVPRAGAVTPPTRTRWGWDVILVAKIEPPASRTLAQAEPEIRDLLFYDLGFDGYRQSKFLAWAGAIGKGARVEVFPDRIPPPAEDQAAALGAAGAAGAPPRAGDDGDGEASGASPGAP